MQDYQKLKIWILGVEIAKSTYQLSKELPKDEKFGFSSQIKRASISISSNIAEGSSRNSKKEFRRYLEIALGSTFELESELILLRELKISDSTQLQFLLGLILKEKKMIYVFTQKLKT